MTTRRGTTNTNQRGNSKDRERRRVWLVEKFRADYDVGPYVDVDDDGQGLYQTVARGFGIPACRCYRCGVLLTAKTVTVDRIIPGCQGGTYRRNNIRPACGLCNSETGGSLRSTTTTRKKAKAA